MKIECIYTITICRLLNHKIPKLNLPPEWLRSFYVQLRIRTARVAGVSMYQEPACTQTLFCFSFGSFRKHRWARERVRSIYFFFFPPPYHPALAVNKSLGVFIFYHARSTDFEEKVEGLWTGQAGVKRDDTKNYSLWCEHLSNMTDSPL